MQGRIRLGVLLRRTRRGRTGPGGRCLALHRSSGSGGRLSAPLLSKSSLALQRSQLGLHLREGTVRVSRRDCGMQSVAGFRVDPKPNPKSLCAALVSRACLQGSIVSSYTICSGTVSVPLVS